MTMIITQITSNTAAVAIMVPITISTFQSLVESGAMVYIVAVAGNCGLMLPSSRAVRRWQRVCVNSDHVLAGPAACRLALGGHRCRRYVLATIGRGSALLRTDETVTLKG